MARNETEIGEGPREFPRTTWGLVAQVGDTGNVRQAGLETLCHRYWKAVYCYVRSAWRTSNADAKDLTQGFFMWLVQADVLERYSPEVGRFRHYLKGLLRNYVRAQQASSGRLKRGGGAKHVALGDELALADLIPDTKSESPEQAFDRLWVEGLMERALLRAQTYFTAAGLELRVQIHEAYELTSGEEQPTYAQVAARLGVKAADVRNHLHHMRERIRIEVRAELRETVNSPGDLDAEWQELFR
ncbi:MAG: sigma-70 family RNA polymerase sigma factor [Planctomycetes bacterium]|nr:sigma-70 family RNA polymerase sigma factor [Planctomycetota bacterium]